MREFAQIMSERNVDTCMTIWTSKERLIKAGASESVFDAVNRGLSRHGYIARGGQIVDASIVQVLRQSLNREEKSIVVSSGCQPSGTIAHRR